MPDTILTEKVSVNINTATLSSIDLLIDQGYYSNRSDFINQALREGLQKHQTTLDKLIDAKTEACKTQPARWFVGLYGVEKHEIELAQSRGETFSITGYGVLMIDEEIDPDALFAVVERIKIKGRVVCKPEVKKHYGLK